MLASGAVLAHTVVVTMRTTSNERGRADRQIVAIRNSLTYVLSWPTFGRDGGRTTDPEFRFVRRHVRELVARGAPRWARVLTWVSAGGVARRSLLGRRSIAALLCSG